MANYTDAERKQIKAAFLCFRRFQSIFREFRQAKLLFHWATVSDAVAAVQAEAEALRSNFPNLVPEFKPDGGPSGESYIARVLPRLEVALEEEVGLSFEELQFGFIQDEKLRIIIERDYQEAQRALMVKCWKSVIILSGSAFETVLLDLLLNHESEAKAAQARPNKPDLRSWDLSDLIKVTVELELVPPMVETLADPVRQYRNLVHPGRELRTGLKPDRYEAESGLTVLKIIHRERSNAV